MGFKVSNNEKLLASLKLEAPQPPKAGEPGYQPLLLIYSVEEKDDLDSGTTYRVPNAQLLVKGKRYLVDDWNSPIQVISIYKGPLLKKAGNKNKNKSQKGDEPKSCHCVVFHAYVIFKTAEWFYSIEKDNERVILQASPSISQYNM